MPLPRQYFIDKTRKENADLANVSDEIVYLYGIKANPYINVEPWDEVTAGAPTEELIANPTPALFDYLDWGINENSYGWVKDAYVSSLTGMTEQLISGKPRFDLSDYEENKTLMEDIGGTALSFFMPIDLATLKGGGVLGRMAVNGMIKRGAMKLTAEGGLSKGAAIAAQMIGQVGALSTYEGSIGYVNAKNQGMSTKDAIIEAGKGVLHGAMIGTITGGIGAGMGGKHAELLALGEKGTLTAGQKVTKALTGKVGQYGAEVGAFQGITTFDHLVHEGHLPDREQFLYDLTFNAGLIGALRLTHGTIDRTLKTLKRDKGEIKNVKETDISSDAIDGVLETINHPSTPQATKEVLLPLLTQYKSDLKKSLNDKSIDIDTYIALGEHLLENVKKAKRADSGTVQLLKDTIEFLNAGYEIVGKTKDIYKTKLSAEDVLESERKAVEKDYDNVPKLMEEIDLQLNKLNENAIDKDASPKPDAPTMYPKDTIINMFSPEGGGIKGRGTGQLLDKVGNKLVDLEGVDLNTAEGRVEATKRVDSFLKRQRDIKREPTELLEPTKEPYDKKLELELEEIDIGEASTHIETVGKEAGLGETDLKRIKVAADKDRRKFSPRGMDKKPWIDVYKQRLNKFIDLFKFLKEKGTTFENMKPSDFKEWALRNRPEGEKTLSVGQKRILRNQIGESLSLKSSILEVIDTIPETPKTPIVVLTTKEYKTEMKKTEVALDTKVDVPLSEKGKRKFPNTLAKLFTWLKGRWGHRNVPFYKGNTKVEDVHRAGDVRDLKGALTKRGTGNIIGVWLYEKLGKRRFAFIEPPLAKELGEYLKNRKDSDPLFTGTDGKTLSEGNVRDLFKRLISGDKVEVQPHSIRHFLMTSARYMDKRSKGKTNYEAFVSKIFLMHEPTKTSISTSDIPYLLDLQKGDRSVIKDFKEFHKELEKLDVDFNSKEFKETHEAVYEAYFSKEGEIKGAKQFEAREGEGLDITEPFIREQREKNPGLEIFVNKNAPNKRYAGKFFKGLIELVEGKGNIHTFFHEQGHRLKEFVRESGDTKTLAVIERAEKMFGSWAKNNDKAWNEYYMKKYKTEAKAREEYFADRMADWAAKRQVNKGLLSRLSQNAKLIFSRIKKFFGVDNKKDLARILGERVYRGFKTEGVAFKGEAKFKQTERAKRSKQEIRESIRERLKDSDVPKDLLDLDKPSETLRDLAEQMGLDVPEGVKKLKLSDIRDESVLESISAVVDKLIPKKTTKGKRRKYSKDKLRLILDALVINEKHGVTEKVFSETLELFNVKDGLVDNASKDVLMEYINIVKDKAILKELPENTLDTALAMDNKQSAFKSLPIWKRMMMPVFDVLMKYGGAPGKAIGRRILNHGYIEAQYFGHGDAVINTMHNLVGKKGLNRLWLIDAQRQSEMLGKWEHKLSNGDKKFIEALKDKNSNEYKASQMYEKMMNFYWESLQKEASRWNNPAEMEKLRREMNEKFVKRYFTRRITKEARDILTKDTSYIDKIAEGGLQDAAKYKAMSDLKKQGVDVDKSKERVAKEIRRLLADDTFINNYKADVHAMFQFGASKVKNPYLLERKMKLDEFLKDDKGKLVRTYETKLEHTGERYVRTMAKYLATIRYFPEFTEVAGKYTVKKIKGSLIDAISDSNQLGEYAAKAVTRAIGLREATLDGTVLRGLETTARWSAVAGLSSPFSGIKNLILGTIQSIGTMGLKNTVLAARNLWNKDSRLYVRQIGGVEFGSKHLELTGFAEKVFRFNLMTQTEGMNRIVAVYAGKLFYADLLKSLQGGKGIFAKANMKRAEDTIKRIWKLRQRDVDFLKGYNELTANRASKNLFNDIQRRVDHFSHLATQGGTSTALMPLWMSGRVAKPFTLFQRMAYAATWNSYNNYLKPIKSHGNIMPLARFATASWAGGALLYKMFDYFLDIEPPKSQKKDALFSNALMNLWKAETLGVFTEGLNLHKPSPVITPIMTPVIIRHTQEVAKAFTSWMSGGKTNVESALDFGKQFAPIFNQALRKSENIKSPYSMNTKKINTLKRTFMREQDYKKGTAVEVQGHEQMPFYRKFKADFAAGGDNMIRSYFAAYNFLVVDFLQNAKNLNPTPADVRQAHKNARSRLQQVITRLHPVSLSKETAKRGRVISVADEFRTWLAPENRNTLKLLENEYGYKLRQLEKLFIKHYKQSSVFPYKFVL